MKKNIVLAGLMAAMICLATTFLHINVGTSGYIHLGDTIIYMAAVLLPTPYAVAAASIGGVLADIFSGAAVWAFFAASVTARSRLSVETVTEVTVSACWSSAAVLPTQWAAKSSAC